MKNLYLVLVALFATSALALASFDSDDATIFKVSEHTAKVVLDKHDYKVSVTFDDGATWDNVKDHYELDPSVAEGIKKGDIYINIGSDGTASFKKTTMKKVKDSVNKVL